MINKKSGLLLSFIVVNRVQLENVQVKKLSKQIRPGLVSIPGPGQKQSKVHQNTEINQQRKKYKVKTPVLKSQYDKTKRLMSEKTKFRLGESL